LYEDVITNNKKKLSLLSSGICVIDIHLICFVNFENLSEEKIITIVEVNQSGFNQKNKRKIDRDRDIHFTN